MRASYIIALDNNFELTNNFFSILIKERNIQDEIILVIDGCNNLKTVDYVNKLNKQEKNFRLITLDKKVGYSKANNIAVSYSSGDILIFLNSDVFINSKSMEVLIKTLNDDESIGAVQPLLLYPQNDNVQSTGHLFIDYQSKHIFENSKKNSVVVKTSGERQALCTALCLIKRNIFLDLGGFDEYYFNSHEGMELTLKIYLSGKKCIYCANAYAYHCRGAATGIIKFDHNRQKTHFYEKWYKHIKIDIVKYLKMGLNENINSNYIVLNFSKSKIWFNVLKQLNLDYSDNIDFEEKFNDKINLFYCLPHDSLSYRGEYLFLCDNINQLSNNIQWFKIRNNRNDIIMDLSGNVIYVNKEWN